MRGISKGRAKKYKYIILYIYIYTYFYIWRFPAIGVQYPKSSILIGLSLINITIYGKPPYVIVYYIYKYCVYNNISVQPIWKM